MESSTKSVLQEQLLRQQLLDDSDLQAIPDLFAKNITKVGQFSLHGTPFAEFALCA